MAETTDDDTSASAGSHKARATSSASRKNPSAAQAPLPNLDYTTLKAQGLNFNVATAGPADGPLVMMLHGFPESSFAWRHQAGALADAGFRVAMPDQRGYGKSDKPDGRSAYRLETLAEDVLELADALGPHDRFAVVGHDWGGVLAWYLAEHHAERIERAAILNAPHLATLLRYSLKNPIQLFRGMYIGFFQFPVLPEITLQANNYRALTLALTKTAQPGTFSEAELDAYRRDWAEPGAMTGMLNWYRALTLPRTASRESSASRKDQRITMPIRLIWGDRDTALSPGLAEEGIALCDNAEVIHLPEASHWLHLEDSARINQLLIEFLSQRA